jgi:hypothetical protein
MGSLAVTLAGGVWREGTPRRDAVVRTLSADEERRLVDEALVLAPAELVTRLLDRCAEVGGERGSELARVLTIGDRAALLLAFHRLTSGDALPCLVDCTACGVRFELELDAASLVAEQVSPPAPVLEAEVDGKRVSFRLPTGADEERAAHAALADAGEAADELLRRCVIEGRGLPRERLVEVVENAIAEWDPHAEIELGFTCPDCGAESTAVFEPGSYVLDEVSARTAALEREVHELASRYGWGESEILALPAARRRRYLELIEAMEAQ